MSTQTRRRGAALEEALHRATVEELDAVGYSALTIEGVARRAQTGKAALYRRWASKKDLVIDSLLRILPLPRSVAASPSLRDRLIATLTIMGEAMSGGAGFPRFDVLIDAMRVEPEIRDAFRNRVIEPRLLLVEGLLRESGVPEGVDLRLLARVGPALLLEEFLLTGSPPTREEITHLVDTVLLPLIG